MIKSEGFIIQTSYRSPSGALKFKPGYLTQEAGSVLEFEFDASFEDAWAAPEPQSPRPGGGLVVAWWWPAPGW